MAEEYGGLIGAYRYAIRASGSWLFRSYALLSAFVGLYVGVLIALGLVGWLARPTGLIGEHALLVVLGILIVAPLFAPVLIVARRHRLGGGRRRSDAVLALAGYGFFLSVLAALVVTDPDDHAVSGAAGVVIGALDSLPRVYGLVVPVIGGALVALAARLTGGRA